MKLYREVKASERLPNSLEVVTAYYDDYTDVAYVFYDEAGKRWHYAFGPSLIESYPEAWIEPIEITEEEIEEICKKTMNKKYPECSRMAKGDEFWAAVHEESVQDCIDAVKAILSKLKGE